MAIKAQQIHLFVPKPHRWVGHHLMLDITGRIHHQYDGWCEEPDKSRVVTIGRTLGDHNIIKTIAHEGYHLVDFEQPSEIAEKRAEALGWYVAEALTQIYEFEAKE